MILSEQQTCKFMTQNLEGKVTELTSNSTKRKYLPESLGYTDCFHSKVQKLNPMVSVWFSQSNKPTGISVWKHNVAGKVAEQTYNSTNAILTWRLGLYGRVPQQFGCDTPVGLGTIFPKQQAYVCTTDKVKCKFHGRYEQNSQYNLFPQVKRLSNEILVSIYRMRLKGKLYFKVLLSYFYIKIPLPLSKEVRSWQRRIFSLRGYESMQFYHLDTTLLEISSSLCAATWGKPTAPITTQNLL